MKLCDINPHIRFAGQIHYKSADNPVLVRDCRLFYIISGAGEIFIENQHYILSDNSLFYCSAGSRYNIKSEKGLSLISLNFDLSQKNNAALEAYIPTPQTEMIKVFFDEVSDSTILNSHIYLPEASAFYSEVSRIFYEFTTKKIHFREISGAFLKGILINIHRAELEKTSASADAVSTVIDYINANFSKDIQNNELALLAGYHEYHLNRLFLQHTGTSMHNYILSMRINEAKRLILNTDLPLITIAENVGFKSYTHFSSYFKKIFLLSPAAYRNKFKNNI